MKAVRAPAEPMITSRFAEEKVAENGEVANCKKIIERYNIQIGCGDSSCL